MLTIKEIKLEDDFSWEELMGGSETATFFQSKEWLSLWVKHWGQGIKIVIYGVYEDDKLLGIAPFGISDKINILAAPDPSQSASFSDFGDIIISNGKEKEVWEVVLKQLKRMRLPIELNFIRENSPSFRILKDLGGKAEEMEAAPFSDLPKTWDEYLSKLDRHDRHEIRRKIRKLGSEATNYLCGEIESDKIEEFYRLMILSDEKKKDFLSSDVKEFLGEAISKFGQMRRMTLCFLKYENVNIAGILLLFQGREVLLYNSGFDPRFSYLSPGVILIAYAIKQAIGEGKEKFDFLRGSEKYKYDLGGIKRNLYKFSFI